MSSIKEKLTGKKSKEDEVLDNVCPKLSFKQRMYGFAGCSIFGWLITLLSFLNFTKLVRGDPAPFAISYSLGNVICIMATCFLSGPKSQTKAIMKKQRLVTFIIFFVSMIATIVFTLVDPLRKTYLWIFFIIAQFCSYFWYAISYIPFAQDTFKSCCKKCLK